MTLQGISASSGTPVEVEIAGDRILWVRPLENAADDLPFLSFGFLDLQVNGYMGKDYSTPDLDAEDIETIISCLAVSGTTRHMATIISNPGDRILRNLRVIAEFVRKNPGRRSALAGVHIEGPFVSGDDGPRGVHDGKFVRDPDFEEFRDWIAAGEGLIKIVTLAPERKGAISFIEKAAAEGIIPAIGHTGADPETIARAVAAGARLSTHLGNGSYVSLPRLRNYIWEQLARDELTIGIISDGFHLPGSVVKVFSRVKSPDKLILVSDAALLGGKSPGIYAWGDVEVEVFPDGHLGMPGTSILAGAAHLLNWDIPRYMEFTGAPLRDAVRLCTINPGRLLGLEPGFGDIRPGSPADVVLFRLPPKGPLVVEKTVASGRVVYERKLGGA
jgi:N-acetylglucosamine-6-phosphate deacetylase